MVQNTNQFISKAGLSSQLDEDDLFGQSVGKELKTLSPYQKSLAKMKIQQILHEIRWSVVENELILMIFLFIVEVLLGLRCSS